jgi:glycosyltransferase involved in cell wall biosynthesis
MGGNAIRAFEIARALADRSEVTLAAPGDPATLSGVDFVPFDRADPRSLRTRLRQADVVVTPPQNALVTRELRLSGAFLVYDLYDVKPLELFEAFAGARAVVRRYWATIALDHFLEALRLGDYFVCATERQRDLWLGAMLASRLITPATYGDDPSLRRLIDVVPFGIPSEPAVARGAGPHERFATLEQDAEIVLWNGGLWNWLDPLTAVEAMPQVLEQRPRARLVFMGSPPGEGRQSEAASAARDRALELGLVDGAVFFNDRRVPYAERAAWLLPASCAVSLHVDHLETRFSFRTRLLDCLWARLPVVCTAGDELADRVQRDRLGMAVAQRDHTAVANAIVEVIARGRGSYGQALADAAEDYLWPKVVTPLAQFVADPDRRLPRKRTGPIVAPARWARATATRAVRSLLRHRAPF